MLTATMGYRIDVHCRRVTIWYFNEQGALYATDIFTPNPTLTKQVRLERIMRRINLAKECVK